MASSKLVLAAIFSASLCFTAALAFPDHHDQGAYPVGQSPKPVLSPDYYKATCPQADEIVVSILKKAIAKEQRIAASLLRLLFHDCFVQGCDASVLLDDSEEFISEKKAIPNKNSIRGFEVIDEIKAALEEACPHTVSCADTIALAARGSTVLSGGPYWELPLGRKDSKAAYMKLANKNLPPPNATLHRLVKFFERQGLDKVDLVALSGSHTIGMARCVSFKQRLYNQHRDNQPDRTLEKTLYHTLASVCPPGGGGDSNLRPLDLATASRFDNAYYKLLVEGRGLLNSDEVLWTGGDPEIAGLVRSYAESEPLFFEHYVSSITKMGNITPLTDHDGEIRKNCRVVNKNAV
ncbi:peroxidase 9-like [Oryza brachyantha]|uniref:Peroxidase n=1 Tax=Oryza brachyantha TaxID=4533 RepID=J3KYI6_ORYBR|nr:peroxidase 9-like [Oryza brachyantha]